MSNSLEALQQSSWPYIIMVLVGIALVWVLRSGLGWALHAWDEPPNLLKKVVTFLQGDRGGVILAFLVGFMQPVMDSLVAGEAITKATALAGLKLVAGMILTYVTTKKLIAPKS